jgi:hypothetical protein
MAKKLDSGTGEAFILMLIDVRVKLSPTCNWQFSKVDVLVNEVSGLGYFGNEVTGQM